MLRCAGFSPNSCPWYLGHAGRSGSLVFTVRSFTGNLSLCSAMDSPRPLAVGVPTLLSQCKRGCPSIARTPGVTVVRLDTSSAFLNSSTLSCMDLVIPGCCNRTLRAGRAEMLVLGGWTVRDEGANTAVSGKGPLPGLQTASVSLCPHPQKDRDREEHCAVSS